MALGSSGAGAANDGATALDQLAGGANLEAELRLGVDLAADADKGLGIDLDRDACENARHNARENGMSGGGAFHLVRGTLEAIDAAAHFDLAVANLLFYRLEPWLGRVTGHARRAAILSGYLREEAERVASALARLGWTIRESAEEVSPYDPSGDEYWCACVAIPTPAA